MKIIQFHYVILELLGEDYIADAFTKPLDVNILRRYLVSNLAISMNNLEFNVKTDAEIFDYIHEVNDSR